MFSDIVGYTALVGKSEETGRRVRQRHALLLRPLVERYHGTWVQSVGDETLSSFQSAVDAVNCALAIQAALHDEPDLRIRIGIHIGDIVFEEGSVHGDGVNVASRIRPLAAPGAVCVSEPVHDAVKNQSNLSFEALGAQALKNVEKPLPAFVVRGTPAEPSQITRAARPTPWRSFAAAAAVVAALAAWWLLRPLPTPGPIRSLAVLPLENLSGDPEQEYFADGMTEALIGELAKIGSLRVVSRTSVMRFKGARQPLPQIAEQLGVQGVLEGTVIHEGGRVRVTVQLIDARDDAHVWADHYDRDLGGVLALQSEVAKAVATEVRAELTADARASLGPGQVDPRAYDAYVRGLELYAAQSNWLEIVAGFEQAVERDPNFALAYSWLATSRMRAASAFLLPVSERAGMMPAAVDAARRALELDERQAMAHSTIGLVLLFQWDFAGAGRSLERAMQLSPSDSRVLSAYNWYLLMLGRSEEASEVAERLRLVAPLDALYRENVARSFYHTRDYARALEEFERARELDEEVNAYYLMMIYEQLGRLEESHEAQVALSRRWAAFGIPGRERIAEAQERGWAEGGKEGEIRAAQEVMIELAEEGLYSPFAVAMNYARVGEVDEAFHWLERAYEQREAVLYALKATPFADPLRSDPRYHDLIRRIGFPEG